MVIAVSLLFSMATKTFELPPNLLSSLCYVESTHNTKAIHLNDGKSNSVGICQIKLKTARWLGFRGNEQQLMEPKNNIYYAAKYLRYQITRYKGDVRKAVIAYNMGHARHLTSTEYSVRVYKQWARDNKDEKYSNKVAILQ